MYHKAILILLLFMINTLGIYSQHYLNLVSDHGGSTGQSMNYVCMADSHRICVIGNFTDKDRTHIWPFIAGYDYNGNVSYWDTLRIDGSVDSFKVKKRRPVFKKGTSYYYNAIRYIDDDYYNNIFEIDISNGKIVRSTYLKYSSYGRVNFIHYNRENTLSLVTYVGRKGKNITKDQLHIIELDTNFIIKKHLSIQDSLVSKYIYKTKEGNYEIIGTQDNVYDPETSIFRLLIDSMGNELDFDIHDFDGETSFGWDASVFTVERDEKKNWAIGFVHQKRRKPTDRYSFNDFPYVMSYTRDFDTLLWQTPLLRPHNYDLPRISISSMCKAYDKSGYVTAGSLEILGEINKNSYGKALAFKVSNEGDSLWTRTYNSSAYPVADSIFFWDMRSITATPYGYAMIGTFSDWHLKKFRSFLLHVDKEGCLIPGCDDTISASDIVDKKEKPFKIYPNPVGDQMYILSHIASQDRHAVVFYDMNGVVAHKSYIAPEVGGQYIVFLPSSFVSGMYVMHIQNADGQTIFSEKIVKQ